VGGGGKPRTAKKRGKPGKKGKREEGPVTIPERVFEQKRSLGGDKLTVKLRGVTNNKTKTGNEKQVWSRGSAEVGGENY